jgi:hypothetical protein
MATTDLQTISDSPISEEEKKTDGLNEEQRELEELLSAGFTIKENSGSLPKARTHLTNVTSWVYPASKTFRTY